MDDFNLEHSIIESGIRRDFGVLELPISKRVFTLIFSASAVLVGLIFVRVFYLSFVEGKFYTDRSALNVTEPITLPAIRGLIYDRYGNILAQNEAAQRLVFNAGLALREKTDIEAMLSSISPILDISIPDLQVMVQKADIEKIPLITLARNISPEQAGAVQKLNMKALEIQADYTRRYARGPAFAQVLGYTGPAEYGDVHGKTGLEKYYDDAISGKDGVRIMYRTAKGTILDEKLLDAPQRGENLHTTIDADLQEYFYNRLTAALKSLGRNVGVGIVMNPQTGEVLAMVNAPSYDNNVFTDLKSKQARLATLTAPFQPLFDRAVSGTYTPGSTIKPMVAIAGLKEGVITPQSQVFSKGYIELPNQYDPAHPSRFLDWKPNGWVNVRSALAKSSNIFFYSVGGGFGDIKGLGIDKLKEWWKFFGYGQKTGIDLDAESVGFLPDPQEKLADKNDPWRIGDTFNVTIGQGDFQVTPIQLITQISSIAAGGKLYRPFLMKELANDTGTSTVRQPELVRDYSDLAPEIQEVQEGMKDAVRQPYGTANLLSSLPFEVAAKTGTSQTFNNTKVNALFVGYIPTEALARAGVSADKQIAILVLVENAKEGSLNVVPVGKDVLDWYYRNRIIKNPQ